MSVAALLGGLVLIILILGFVTALQNRSATRGGRRHKAPMLKNETDEALEKRQPAHRQKKSSAPHRQEHESTPSYHHESGRRQEHQDKVHQDSGRRQEHQDKVHQDSVHQEKHRNNISSAHKRH